MKIVRATYRKEGEQLERIVYGQSLSSVEAKIRQLCDCRDKFWRKRVRLSTELMEFEPNGRGIVKALQQGFKDSLDYGEWLYKATYVEQSLKIYGVFW